MTEAWVTLATNDIYALGCQVLGHSLRKVETTRKLAVMVTPGVSESMRAQLASVFDHVISVDVLDSNDTENLQLIKRPDLGITFTKLHCWRLTQFTKCVFLDADTLVVQNSDELFEREEFSAAPDIGWPDMFNSGVFVFSPSRETYHALLEAAVSSGSFDGGDQGLLNSFFHTWARGDTKFRLPFVYNMSLSASYGYAAALKQFGKDIKIVHFLGSVKPWHHTFNTTTSTVQMRNDSGCSKEHLEAWWSIFASKVMQQQFHRDRLKGRTSDFRLDEFCAYPSDAVVESVRNKLTFMENLELKAEEKIEYRTSIDNGYNNANYSDVWSTQSTVGSSTQEYQSDDNNNEPATFTSSDGVLKLPQDIKNSVLSYPQVGNEKLDVSYKLPPFAPASRRLSPDRYLLDDELPPLTPANPQLLWLSNQADIDPPASEIGDPHEMSVSEQNRVKQYGSGHDEPETVRSDDLSGPGRFIDLSHGGPMPTSVQRGSVLGSLLGSPFDPVVLRPTEADMELEEMVMEADEQVTEHQINESSEEEDVIDEFLPPLNSEMRETIERIVQVQPLRSSRDLVFSDRQGTQEDVAQVFQLLSISTPSSTPLSDRERQVRWENGQIDYTGADSFAAIQAHMASKLE